MGLFILRTKEKSILFFGLFCVLIAFRILVTGERYLIGLFPDFSWEVHVKIDYLTFYIGAPVKEVKTLSGLLPICASCKNIRDDKGYWAQMEVYISDHSGAIFSHGICPDCAEKLYPEIYSKNDP